MKEVLPLKRNTAQQEKEEPYEKEVHRFGQPKQSKERNNQL